MELLFDERPGDSLFIERVWHNYSESENPFTSVADTHWGIAITKHEGKTTFTFRGPETKPSAAIAPANAEFMGIQFKLGTYMPDFPAKSLMDRNDFNIPESVKGRFPLNGASWEIPDYENAEDFVTRLVKEGLLVHDPLVKYALEGQPVGMTLRTVQRRFLQSTGLTLGTIYQIQRARLAARLLKQGFSILDTVEQAGYFDQAHLSKGLKRYIGLSPAQISPQNRKTVLSFLYNTEPF